MPERFTLDNGAFVRRPDEDPTVFEQDLHPTPTILLALSRDGDAAILVQPKTNIPQILPASVPETKKTLLQTTIPQNSEGVNYFLVTQINEWQAHMLRDRLDAEDIIFHRHLLPVFEPDGDKKSHPPLYSSFAEALADIQDYSHARFEATIDNSSISKEPAHVFMRRMIFTNLSRIREKNTPEFWAGQVGAELKSALQHFRFLLDDYVSILQDVQKETGGTRSELIQRLIGEENSTTALNPHTVKLDTQLQFVFSGQLSPDAWAQEVGKTFIADILNTNDSQTIFQAYSHFSPRLQEIDYTNGFTQGLIDGINFHLLPQNSTW